MFLWLQTYHKGQSKNRRLECTLNTHDTAPPTNSLLYRDGALPSFTYKYNYENACMQNFHIVVAKCSRYHITYTEPKYRTWFITQPFLIRIHKTAHRNVMYNINSGHIWHNKKSNNEFTKKRNTVQSTISDSNCTHF